MPRRLIQRSLAACAVMVPCAALGAPPKSAPPAKPEPAQALFDSGVAEMEAGRFDKACPAIQASQRMSPMPGTLFTLAECEAKRGRLATAMRYYAEYLTLYRTFNDRKKLEQKERAKISQDQLTKLEPLVPRLTLRLPKGAQSDVVVKRDNDVVAELSLGTPLPVDPGEHLVTTQVPGGPEVPHRVTVWVRESKTLELTIRTTPFPTAPLVTAAPKPTERPVDPRPYLIGGASAGAVGILGVVVGAVAGILAIDQHNQANKLCKPPDASGAVHCDPEGYAAATRADTFGAVSTTGFIVGGLGLGVGIILLASKPSAPTQSPGVGKGQSAGLPLQSLSLTFGGNF